MGKRSNAAKLVGVRNPFVTGESEPFDSLFKAGELITERLQTVRMKPGMHEGSF
jgi:hypothetical protein